MMQTVRDGRAALIGPGLARPLTTLTRKGVDTHCAIAAAERMLELPDSDAVARDGARYPPTLPLLDEEEEALVRSGGRLRWQQPPGPGGEGIGFAVQELHADVADVWQAVSAFSDYDELISTVRTVTPYDPPEEVPRASNVCHYSFLVSRLRLRLDVRFTVNDAQRYALWQLDQPSWVLADSTGYWRVVPCADRPGVVRVWFCVSVRLRTRVPKFVIGLVSRLGLDKATRWLGQLEAKP